MVGSMPTVTRWQSMSFAVAWQAPQVAASSSSSPREGAAGECRGAAVQFHVEAGQFRHHQRVVQAFEKLVIPGQRIALAVHQPGFQFETGDVATLAETGRSELLARSFVSSSRRNRKTLKSSALK